MAAKNLRPDLIIKQEFANPAPASVTTGVPVLLMGVQRNFAYRQPLPVSGWNGSSPVVAEDFPAWKGGSVNGVLSGNILRPRVEVSSDFGIAELTSGVTFANLAAQPTVSIAAGASATFTVASGTTGAFSLEALTPLLSKFSDDKSDFVLAGVSAGDKIKVGTSVLFEVADEGLASETELLVKRIDKGASKAGASQAAAYFLSAEDSNGLRSLVVTSAGYVADGGFSEFGVTPGDNVTINYWKTLHSVTNGISFTSVGAEIGDIVGGYTLTANDRLLTVATNSTYKDADGAGVGTAAVPAWDNTAGTGGVWFLQRGDGQFEPAFYAKSTYTAPGGGDNTFAVRDYGDTFISESLAQSDVTGRWFNYTRIGGVRTGGAFTILNENNTRTFTAAGVDWTSGGMAVGDHIAIAGTDGIYKPIFEITATSYLAATVKQLTSFPSGLTAGSNITFVILDATGANKSATEGVGANLSYNAITDTYTLVHSDKVFNSDNAVAVGDLVFSTGGALLFIVSVVAPDGASNTLSLKAHPNAGATPSLFLNGSGSFYYSVRDNLPAVFAVTTVSNDSTLLIREVLSTPNTIPNSTTVAGFIHFQTAPSVDGSGNVTQYGADIGTIVCADSLANLKYSIDKTLSGAQLEGDLLLSYTENATDLVEPTLVTASTYTTVAGPAVPDNPLGLAASIAFSNATAPLYVLNVADDTVEAWTEALAATETDTVYQIVPLTSDSEILGIVRAHVIAQSAPTLKRERIMWQSQRFTDEAVKYSFTSSNGSLLTKTAQGKQTITFTDDIEAAGVVIGDIITASVYDGTSEITFSGKVTKLVTLGSSTVATMIASNAIPLSVTNLIVNTCTIKEAPKTQAKKAEAVAAFTTAISNRRIRNVFPDQVVITFNDTTGGFYGATTEQTLSALYVAVALAARRTAVTVATPLTKQALTGFKKLLDPLKGKQSLQDIVIDGGSTYVEQTGGDNGPVSAIRALSTDTSDAFFYEESVTVQIDSFARNLRAAVKPILGPNILDARFFDLLSAVQQGVRDRAISNREIAFVNMKSLTQDPNAPDSFQMVFNMRPFFSGAKGEVTLVIG